jgi:hypothetical protein
MVCPVLRINIRKSIGVFSPFRQRTHQVQQCSKTQVGRNISDCTAASGFLASTGLAMQTMHGPLRPSSILCSVSLPHLLHQTAALMMFFG